MVWHAVVASVCKAQCTHQEVWEWPGLPRLVEIRLCSTAHPCKSCTQYGQRSAAVPTEQQMQHLGSMKGSGAWASTR
jgi:hypothetical protein